MIAAHLDNLLFLLLIAVAVLFQFLAKAAGKTGKDQKKRTSTPRAPTPMRRAPAESDEERIRKLLEALGQPPTSRPPPLVVPRTDIPPRPLTPVQPPMSPLSQLTREKSRQREMISKEIPLPQPVRGPEKMSAFEVHQGSLPITPPPVFKASAETYAGAMPPIAGAEERIGIAMLLASTSGLRNAMILREILGPPRGLRMNDML